MLSLTRSLVVFLSANKTLPGFRVFFYFNRLRYTTGCCKQGNRV